MGKHNFTETMDRAKLLAQIARNRGIPTGKAAKGHTRKRAATPLKGTWERLVGETTARWQNATSGIVCDFLHEINPSRDDIDSFFANGGRL